MPPEKSNRRLGRGLDALFNTAGGQTARESALRDLPVAEIAPNPFQPRRNFSRAELQELEESLRANGLLQAVTVRPAPSGKGYELIAGERRLRAASNLGWKNIAAVVRDLDDKEMLTLALVENLQRFDLNPIEEAEGYARLIQDFAYTQQSVAEMVGKDRSTVANVIRLLQLPPDVRAMMQEGKITSGQARPLLGLENPSLVSSLASRIIEHGWSAREVEARVRESARPSDKKKKGRPHKQDNQTAEVRSIEQKLRKHLQTDVSLSLRKGNRGSLVIEFYSPEDLERLLETMGVPLNPQ
jgi:ParB family chromosome partitioning protein